VLAACITTSVVHRGARLHADGRRTRRELARLHFVGDDAQAILERRQIRQPD
jgi:hypothetical protein